MDIFFSSSSESPSGDCTAIVTGVPKGRYSIMLLGVVYNRAATDETAEFAVTLNINGDNQEFSPKAKGDWTTGSTLIAKESIMPQHGAAIRRIMTDSSTIEAKAHLRSGTLSNRITKITVMVVKLYNKVPTAF
jgi:hypothetical protein